MEKEEVMKVIESKRKQMIEVGMQLGFTHPKTVSCSNEVDWWLNYLERNNTKIKP